MEHEYYVDLLIYPDQGGWVALALQMDLRGYGQTPADARKAVLEMICAQISFAHFKKQPELIWRNAAQEWFEKFEVVRRRQLTALLEHSTTPSEIRIEPLRIPDAHIIDCLKKQQYQVKH